MFLNNQEQSIYREIFATCNVKELGSLCWDNVYVLLYCYNTFQNSKEHLESIEVICVNVTLMAIYTGWAGSILCLNPNVSG